MELIKEPWPWYVSGPCIAITMFLLLYFGRTFGMSSNLRTMCAIGGAGRYSEFFKFDWKSYRWNIIVMIGAVVGGFIAHFFLSNPTDINLSAETIKDLNELGFKNAGNSLLPPELFAWENVLTLKGISILIIGGFLVGFTSGHAITGLSSLQLPSLIAVIGFFIGGLIMIYLIFPILF
jgi:hypothetical protein